MSSRAVDVRAARPGEASAILSVASAALPHFHLSPLSSGKADAYLDRLITAGAVSSRRTFVAAVGGVIVGMAEIRLLPGEVFLNHIAVSAEFRGAGVGAALLTKALVACRQEDAAMLRLDVFADNPLARAWYESLGLAVEQTRYWVDLGHPQGLEGWWVVDRLPMADIQHDRFGFSEFALHTRQRSYVVGRIGRDIGRSAGIASDQEALGALRVIFRGRVLWSLEREAPDAGKSLEVLRMAGDLDEAIRALT